MENTSTNITYSDDIIIDGLKHHDSKIIKYLYKEYYPTIKFLIMTNSGKEEQAEDIFQEALLIIYRKIVRENLILTGSFKTFLYSVSRNLWLQQLDRNFFDFNSLELETLEFNDSEECASLMELESKIEKYTIFQSHFLNLSADCQKILKLYLSNYSIEEITKQMGFDSEIYTKRRLYNCKAKLIKKVHQDHNFQKYLLK